MVMSISGTSATQRWAKNSKAIQKLQIFATEKEKLILKVLYFLDQFAGFFEVTKKN